jgi:hypothetical protein
VNFMAGSSREDQTWPILPGNSGEVKSFGSNSIVPLSGLPSQNERRLRRRRQRRCRHRQRRPMSSGPAFQDARKIVEPKTPRRYRSDGEEQRCLRRVSLLDAGRAGDRFLDYLMAHATGIVRVFGLGPLAVLGLADDHIGPGAIRIFRSPLFQDDTLR